jgi:hypothetical protein
MAEQCIPFDGRRFRQIGDLVRESAHSLLSWREQNGFHARPEL